MRLARKYTRATPEGLVSVSVTCIELAGNNNWRASGVTLSATGACLGLLSIVRRSLRARELSGAAGDSAHSPAAPFVAAIFANLPVLTLCQLSIAEQKGTIGCQKPLRGRATRAVGSDASRTPRFQQEVGGRQFGSNRSSLSRGGQSQNQCIH
jgi:hypothetical protein